MKSLKKTLVLLVVFSMILSTIVPAFAATDVAGLDCEDQVTRMEALGVIDGFEDGTFRPEETITRAQMAVIVCKMLGINEASANANAGTASKFSDVAANEWYTGWINIASNNGVIAGFPDGTFRPNETLTLNQVLTLCVKALGRGGYVDKMGTWPANYVTEAARLNLLKDVKGASDANRGTVAIICWNTLNTATWYVNSETLDGEVNLNAYDEKTLLAINFSEFTTEDGDLKEVEEVTVLRTPAMDKEIGSRQIVIADTNVKDLYDTVAKYQDEFETAPKRNEDVKTYREGSEIIAYIPEDVCENVEDLYGKELTLIFGEDNEVALVIITDDAIIDNQLITNINLADNKITIDGEEYKYLENVEIYVDNIPFGTGETQLSAVLTAVGVEDVNSTRSITKAVKANAILNSKDKVERLDLTISGNYYIKAGATPTFETDNTTATHMIEQYVIEEIKSKGNVLAVGEASAIYNYKDLLDNEEEPRVIKDGAEIALDEIAEGDVITIASKYVDSAWEMQTIYVSSEKVTGEIDKIARSLVVSVDGTKYYATKGATVATTGDLEDATTPIDYEELKGIDGEQAEVYLNVLGEYVVIVTESSSADGQFAVIDTVYKLNYDEENDDEEFRKIKVLLPDGTTPKYTVKYDDEIDTTKSSVNAEKVTLANLDETFENSLIKFKANANGVVMIEDITFVHEGVEGKIDDMEVKAIAALPDASGVNYDDEIVTNVDMEYDFVDTVFMSYNDTEKELSVLSKGWNSLVGKKTTIATTSLKEANKPIYIVEKDDTSKILDVKLVYVKTTDYAPSDVQFAIVKDVTNNRDESAKETITLTTKDGEATYEVATSIVETDKDRIEIGDFVQFKVSDDKVTEMYRIIDAVSLNMLADDTAIASALVNMSQEIATDKKTVLTQIVTGTTTKEDLVFEYNEKRTDRIYYVDNVISRVNISEDGATVFDLRSMDEFGEGATVLEDVDLAELDGEMIIAIDADETEDGAEVLVIISNK